MSVYAYEHERGTRDYEGEGESVAAARKLALTGARAALEGGFGESSFESDGEQMAAGKPKRTSRARTALGKVMPVVVAGTQLAADVAAGNDKQARDDLNTLAMAVDAATGDRRKRDHPQQTTSAPPRNPPPPPPPPSGGFIGVHVNTSGQVPHNYNPGVRMPPVKVSGGQKESESEWETEWETPQTLSPEAALEHLGRAAAEAASEAEMEAFAATMAPLVAALRPSIAPQIMRAAPALAGGLAGVARALGSDAATRPHVRALPTIVRRTANELARRAAEGQPVTPRVAVRSLARQTARTLASRQLSSCAHGRAAAFDRAGAETLAQSLDGESMDLDSIREAWNAIPPHIKQQLFSFARQTWDARGVNLTYLVALAYSFMRGGMAPLPALRTAALQLRIPPRPQSQPPGMSPTQVSQYHLRQLQREHRPGQNPQRRPRSQREAESEFEFMFGPSKKERADAAMKRFNTAEERKKKMETLRDQQKSIVDAPRSGSPMRQAHTPQQVAEAERRLKNAEKAIQRADQASQRALNDFTKAVT